MNNDQKEYIRWLDKCHRPLSKKDKEEWIKYYTRSFHNFNNQVQYNTYLGFLMLDVL